MNDKCNNCLLGDHNVCFCTGDPEVITGKILKCEYYRPINAYNEYFKDGFIQGYMYACRMPTLKREVIKNDE